MEKQDYTANITVPVSSAAAFKSINNISAWWTKDFEGQSQKLNDIFTVRFGETFITIKITAFVPDKKISWLVIDSYKHWLAGNKKEWQNTTINWEISPVDDGTQIHFTHIGLQPALECYAGCEKAWDAYITESLFKAIITVEPAQELK